MSQLLTLLAVMFSSVQWYPGCRSAVGIFIQISCRFSSGREGAGSTWVPTLYPPGWCYPLFIWATWGGLLKGSSHKPVICSVCVYPSQVGLCRRLLVCMFWFRGVTVWLLFYGSFWNDFSQNFTARLFINLQWRGTQYHSIEITAAAVLNG